MSYLVLSPLKTPQLNLRNRLVLPPMSDGVANSDGSVSPATLEFYRERVRGAALGLAIVEYSYVAPYSQRGDHMLGVYSDELLPGLTKLAVLLRELNTPSLLQIAHTGALSRYRPGVDPLPVAPSAMVHPFREKTDGVAARELSEAEIWTIVEQFAAAAVRVQTAGFDGVEIHCAHSMLPNQFLSPLLNKRTDKWGGDIVGRSRFLLEIVRSVRAACGAEYPLYVRLGASDFDERGITLQDGIDTALLAVEAGADGIDISGSLTGAQNPNNKAPGYFAELSAPIRRALRAAGHNDIPVILTGGVNKIEEAEQLLQDEVADLIGVGRALHRDPGWARKEVARLN